MAGWSPAAPPRAISCQRTCDEFFIRQFQIFGSTLGNFDEFRDLLSLIERTGLRPIVDSEFPLVQFHAALDRLESGEQFGKIAIRIGEG